MPKASEIILQYLPGFALLGGLAWIGYSSYLENNPPVDLAGPRSASCDAMRRVGTLDQSSSEACLTNDSVYLSALRSAIEIRGDRIKENLNKLVAKVTDTADRLDASAFKDMSAKRFFEIYDPFAFDGTANQPLKRVRVDLSRVTVGSALEEEEFENLPTLWYRPEDMSEDSVGYQIDLDERVFEVMEFPFWFGCDDILDIDGGCQGSIFVDLRSDAVSEATPIVIGFDMKELSARQAVEIVYGLSSPRFSESTAEYDAARMKEVAAMF